MNMNYGFLTTMYESIFTQMFILPVEKYVLQFWLKNFHSKKENIVNNTRKTSFSKNYTKTTALEWSVASKLPGEGGLRILYCAQTFTLDFGVILDANDDF